MARKDIPVSHLLTLLPPTVKDLLKQYGKAVLEDGAPIKASKHPDELRPFLDKGYRIDTDAMVWRSAKQCEIRNAITSFFMSLHPENPQCVTKQDWELMRMRQQVAFEVCRQYERSV